MRSIAETSAAAVARAGWTPEADGRLAAPRRDRDRAALVTPTQRRQASVVDALRRPAGPARVLG